MKTIRTSKALSLLAVMLLSGTLLLGGCVNITPTGSSGSPAPSVPSAGTGVTKVVYNYDDTSKVRLSANNLVLNVGDKLVLQPAAGLTKNTRFRSEGNYFIGGIMKQETDQPNSGQVVFTAVKPGKGQLKVIPDTDKTDRAVDLWVTVQ